MYSYEILKNRVKSYKEFSKTSELHQTIRRPNFPEDISENIVKIFLECSNIKPGDLYSETLGKIEVNCFSSDGPLSFGPKEKWKTLVVLDAKNYQKDEYFLHLLNIPSDDFNFTCNKKETYKDQINQKRRPRTSWKKLYSKVKNHCRTFKIRLDSSFIIGNEIEFPANLYK